ncbi:hypothetical protein H4Q26_011213 [Puccinia striiformis f. sp. tritici PST-130]|uniref:Uncharacterized protein n=1 Tax=Puccinia striiformis f. sp. tritici PST-78 TaxID=1165861 RepID=A0A0L0UTF3_9BASI|nr:hypothetical protein H4Q26_011213 [Puccinia striiformis f. sp. tritici PST-130]KNE90300.1 hypothetical protein PSTG_16255 [Puccinia striiformis f. sp. tritici PST-78]
MQNTTVESRADAKIFIRTAPKLAANKPHQDGAPAKQPTKTLEQRIADPRDDIIKTLASQITDSLVADLSNEGTDEDEVVA